jgi:hypothetical protein
MLEKPQALGAESVVIVEGRGDYGFAHQVRMTDADPKDHIAAVAIAEKVDPLDRELSEKRGGVVHHLLKG